MLENIVGKAVNTFLSGCFTKKNPLLHGHLNT